jgi:hypothetical protein
LLTVGKLLIGPYNKLIKPPVNYIYSHKAYQIDDPQELGAMAYSSKLREVNT